MLKLVPLGVTWIACLGPLSAWSSPRVWARPLRQVYEAIAESASLVIPSVVLGEPGYSILARVAIRICLPWPR